MKRRISRLRKEFYVCDEHGTDKVMVLKINELIDTVNRQQEEIERLKKGPKSRK